MAASLTPAIGLGASGALAAARGPNDAGVTNAATKALTPAQKARAAAQEFEAVFLNRMFEEMFTGIEGEGPFGGSGAAGIWRSFLTDEYAKSFARSGGVGIANDVYRSLLAHQEAAQK
jgi:peptidoglycan hydrolase FlgJ